MKQITIPAHIDRLYSGLEFIDNLLKETGINESFRRNIAVAAEEIFVNTASYAHPDGEGDITIFVNIEADNVILEFRDTGKQYNPLEKEDPDISLPVDKREIGGLGIYMVKNIMDSVSYRYENGSNILILEKRR